MNPFEFALLFLLNKHLREGSLLNRKAAGADTEIFKMLQKMKPEKLSDGTYRGDAEFFLNQPVQLPLKKFQSVLKEFAEGSDTPPKAGEDLTREYIPRLANEIANKLQEDGHVKDGIIELTPERLRLIMTMDAQQLQQLIIETFKLEDMPTEMQKDLIDSIAQVVFDGVIAKATLMMTDEQVEDFEKLTESYKDTPEGIEKVLTFIESVVPDFDQILADEVAGVKEELDRPETDEEKAAE